MSDNSRIAILDGPRQMRLARRPKPEPGPGQVLVHFRATALCHSDLEIYTGRFPTVRFPIVLGHEGTGVVAAVGPDVTSVAPGDRVILNPVAACGHCDDCQLGQENLCRNAGIYGINREGSLAEHVAVGERQVFKLPDHVPLESGTIIETLATVRHAQELIKITPTMSVAVLGIGTGGILHVQLARLNGADPVIAVSRTPWKLDLARARGATHAVNTGDEDPVAAVLRITGGRGADLVVEASGSPEMATLSLKLARPGGTILVWGIGTQTVPDLTFFPLYFKELKIVGSRGLATRDYPPSIRMVASGAINVDDLISKTYSLDDVVEAFQFFDAHPHAVTRILVQA